MKASDVFSGKTLKADDIKGKEPVVTIDRVELKSYDDGTKPIVFFVGKEKALVCNRTNWNSIAEILAEDDSDNWAGRRIKLVVARVDFQGKRVDAIRVDAAPSSGREPVRRAPEPPVEAPDESDVPF